MLRKALLCAAIVVAGGSAASAEVVFRGALTLTKVSAQCQNVQKGDSWVAQFHPQFGDQATFEGLSIMFDFGGSGYDTEGGKFSSGAFKAVRSGGLGWGGVFIRPKAEWTQFGSVTYSTPTKPTLTLKGKAKRWNNDGGGLDCEVSFTGSFVRQEQ